MRELMRRELAGDHGARGPEAAHRLGIPVGNTAQGGLRAPGGQHAFGIVDVLQRDGHPVQRTPAAPGRNLGVRLSRRREGAFGHERHVGIEPCVEGRDTCERRLDQIERRQLPRRNHACGVGQRQACKINHVSVPPRPGTPFSPFEGGNRSSCVPRRAAATLRVTCCPPAHPLRVTLSSLPAAPNASPRPRNVCARTDNVPDRDHTCSTTPLLLHQRGLAGYFACLLKDLPARPCGTASERVPRSGRQPLRVGQSSQQIFLDQRTKVNHRCRGQGAVSHEESQLDVAVPGGRGQVCRRDEH